MCGLPPDYIFREYFLFGFLLLQFYQILPIHLIPFHHFSTFRSKFSLHYNTPITPPAPHSSLKDLRGCLLSNRSNILRTDIPVRYPVLFCILLLFCNFAVFLFTTEYMRTDMSLYSNASVSVIGEVSMYLHLAFKYMAFMSYILLYMMKNRAAYLPRNRNIL